MLFCGSSQARISSTADGMKAHQWPSKDHKYLSVMKQDGFVACGRTPMSMTQFSSSAH